MPLRSSSNQFCSHRRPRPTACQDYFGRVQRPESESRYDIRRTLCDRLLAFQCDYPILTRLVCGSNLERDPLGPCGHVTGFEKLSVRLDEVDLIDISFSGEFDNKCGPFDSDSLQLALPVWRASSVTGRARVSIGVQTACNAYKRCTCGCSEDVSSADGWVVSYHGSRWKRSSGPSIRRRRCPA